MEMELQEIKKNEKTRDSKDRIQIEPNDRNLWPFGIKPRKMKKKLSKLKGAKYRAARQMAH